MLVKHEYLIRGRDRESGLYVYWSNRDGWTTDTNKREYYSRHERSFYRLPSAGDAIDNVQWIRLF